MTEKTTITPSRAMRVDPMWSPLSLDEGPPELLVMYSVGANWQQCRGFSSRFPCTNILLLLPGEYNAKLGLNDSVQNRSKIRKGEGQESHGKGENFLLQVLEIRTWKGLLIWRSHHGTESYTYICWLPVLLHWVA
jgi:hypothetical protein